MNPEFQLARFVLYSLSVLIGVGRLALWCYALFRTRRWFFSLLAVSALMSVGFGLVSLAMLWNQQAWLAMFGRSGFMAFYNSLIYAQVIGDVIEITGVAFLVVWLCHSRRVET